MTRYKYLCSQRPPMPGAVPTRGLVEIQDPQDGVESVELNGRSFNCWGYVVYDRPLSNVEMRDYELIFLGTLRVYVPEGVS